MVESFFPKLNKISDNKFNLELTSDNALYLAYRITRCNCIESMIRAKEKNKDHVGGPYIENILMYAVTTPFSHECNSSNSE